MPVGTLEEQELVIVTKVGGEIRTRRATGCRFVPLRGAEGWGQEGE